MMKICSKHRQIDMAFNGNEYNGCPACAQVQALELTIENLNTGRIKPELEELNK